jgi:plastocyanin
VRPSLRVARAVASLSGAAALLAYAFAGTSAAEDQTVQANGQNQFAPADVTIDPGDTVTWQYAGGFGHTVTSTSANWSKDDALGPPSASLQTSYLFDRPGTYTYVCKTHESVGMRGTVTVTGTTPTRPPTTRPVTRPPTTRPATRPPTTPPRSGSPSVTPTPSASSATPPVLPSGSVSPTLTTPPPSPTALPGESVGPGESGTPYLGVGGLTPAPPSNRAKGLPVMVALLLIGGVGSAEVRALLANAPE